MQHRPPRTYTFAGRLAAGEPDDPERIRRALRSYFPEAGPGGVTRLTTNGDDGGVDWIVHLPGGRVVTVDNKHCADWRRARYWKPDHLPLPRREPDFALELWSVRGPPDTTPNDRWKIGWTLDTSKLHEYILHTFPPQVHARVYLVPYQLERIAFTTFKAEWTRQYKVAIQHTEDKGDYYSECVFVPASVVRDAVHKVAARRDQRALFASP